MKKWKTELIVIVVIAIAVCAVWWFVATRDVRADEARYEAMVRFANRQLVEIAIIRQSSELEQLRAAFRKAELSDISPVKPDDDR